MTDQDGPDDPAPDEPTPDESAGDQQPAATPVPGAFAGAAFTVTYTYDATGGLHISAGPSPLSARGHVATYDYDARRTPPLP